MSLFDRLFPRRKEEIEVQNYFRLLTGYQPVFTSFSGSVFESDLVRSVIDTKARHCSKLAVTLQGSAKPTLQTLLKHAPNSFQTWSQFLYRTSTILDVRNTAFIVPVIDKYGETTGIYTVCPASWDLVQVKEDPWIRFHFESRDSLAIELNRIGILTKYQYKSDLFGENNSALRETLDLMAIQRQGIEESVKNAATYRLMARVTNFTKPEDLAKERKRFDEENFQNGGGGILLIPNTYTDIKQLQQQSYSVDANQLKVIKESVYGYYGINEDVLTSKAYGDAFSAYYESVIEPFAIQLSEVMTKMLFTNREQSSGSEVFFTSNRLQYMTNADKLNVSSQMLDRGILTINDVRQIWQLPPVDGGDVRIIRGEYYPADARINNEEVNDD